MDWQTIKHFGKVKYFNISYIALLFIPIVNEIIEKINILLESPIYFLPGTIKLLYGASLFFALGIAVYQFFCPSLIKSYDKAQDYIRDNISIYLTAYPDLKLEIIRANLSDFQKVSREKIEELVKRKDIAAHVDLQKEMDMLLPSCVQNYLTKEYNSALVKFKFLLWVALVFYISGISIVVFLLFRKSYYVIF